MLLIFFYLYLFINQKIIYLVKKNINIIKKSNTYYYINKKYIINVFQYVSLLHAIIYAYLIQFYIN
jgi:hypothetical protein